METCQVIYFSHVAVAASGKAYLECIRAAVCGASSSGGFDSI